MFNNTINIKSIILFASVFLALSCGQGKDLIEEQTTNFCADIHRNDSISLTKELEDISELMSSKTGVYVLEDGGNAMITRAWFSEYAEKSIDIQYFIFSTDNVGLIACDYLVRAANRGVRVRIIIDDIMVNTGLQDVLTLDSHENISIKIYNPGVNLGKNILQKVKKLTEEFRSANQRMHNKTFIVDGKIVITGGRNIADEYFDYDHEYNFRDRDVLLLGKVSADVNNSFYDFWNSELSYPVTEISNEQPKNVSDPNRFARLYEYACNPENFSPEVREKLKNFPATFNDMKNSENFVWVDDVIFVSDDPGKNDGSKGLNGGGICTDALVDLIKNAKSSIAIQTPYLITTELGQSLFRDAVKRGVKVRILTNSLASTDNVEAFSGYQGDRKTLLNTGVRIFEFRPDAAVRMKIMTSDLQAELEYKPIFGMHAKSMVVDGKLTVIGTFNLDPRSANLNTECVAIISSKSIADKVLVQMEEDFKPENSWETTLDFNPDSEAGKWKQAKSWTRKAIPKAIL